METASLYIALRNNESQIKKRCLTLLDNRASFSSETINLEQLLDLLAASGFVHLKNNEAAGLFVELGTRLAREGWPVRLVLEVVHSYSTAVWLELGSKQSTGESGSEQALAEASLDFDEYWHWCLSINTWVEWLADAYFAQKEEYITELYQEVTSQQSIRQIELEAAKATAGAICHQLNQPLTALNILAELAHEGLQLEDIMLLQEAIAQANSIVQQLQNINRYVTTPYLDKNVILDLKAASVVKSEAKNTN